MQPSVTRRAALAALSATVLPVHAHDPARDLVPRRRRDGKLIATESRNNARIIRAANIQAE